MSEEIPTTTTVDGAAAAKAIDDKANAANAAAAEKKPEPKVAAPDKVEKKPEPKVAAKKTEDEDEDPEPDDKGMVTLPYKTFIKRVARMSKRELVKAFGTDDVESIVKEREELKTLRADKEKRDREAMSEKERLEADLKAARAETEEHKAKAEAAETRVMVRETHRDLEKLAGKYVEDDDVDDVLSRLKAYMRTNKDEITRTKHAEAWIKEFVAKRPKYAKASEAAGEGDKKPEPKKVPATTGGDKRPDAKPNGAPGPKNAMQMSKEELRVALAKNGLTP